MARIRYKRDAMFRVSQVTGAERAFARNLLYESGRPRQTDLCLNQFIGKPAFYQISSQGCSTLT